MWMMWTGSKTYLLPNGGMQYPSVVPTGTALISKTGLNYIQLWRAKQIGVFTDALMALPLLPLTSLEVQWTRSKKEQKSESRWLVLDHIIWKGKKYTQVKPAFWKWMINRGDYFDKFAWYEYIIFLLYLYYDSNNQHIKGCRHSICFLNFFFRNSLI